jgi:hypothetical protein
MLFLLGKNLNLNIHDDLSKEVKNVIPIRKEYGVYVKEDDIAVAELEIYFKEIHYLLKDLDDL